MSNLPIPYDELVALLRTQVAGLFTTEAALELLVAHDHWLRRPEFVAACCGPCDDDGGTPMWWIDWDAVASFGGASSSGEYRIRCLAAELAGVVTRVSLSDLIVRLDPTNLSRVLDAVAHVGGWHERFLTHTVTGWVEAEEDRPCL